MMDGGQPYTINTEQYSVQVYGHMMLIILIISIFTGQWAEVF